MQDRSSARIYLPSTVRGSSKSIRVTRCWLRFPVERFNASFGRRRPWTRIVWPSTELALTLYGKKSISGRAVSLEVTLPATRRDCFCVALLEIPDLIADPYESFQDSVATVWERLGNVRPACELEDARIERINVARNFYEIDDVDVYFDHASCEADRYDLVKRNRVVAPGGGTLVRRSSHEVYFVLKLENPDVGRHVGGDLVRDLTPAGFSGLEEPLRARWEASGLGAAFSVPHFRSDGTERTYSYRLDFDRRTEEVSRLVDRRV